MTPQKQGVEGILWRRLPLGSEGRLLEEIHLVQVGFVGGSVGLDGHLVLGESSSLVGAEHVEPSKIVDGSQPTYDGTVG